MADMRDLAIYMNSFLQNNPPANLASALAVRVATAIIEDLALTTPADVGEALSNWQTTLDAPASAILPAFVPSPKGRVIRGKWTHRVPPHLTVAANAPEVISAAQTILRAKLPGQAIFITNNAEYIILLNQGSSDQSPANFVERARIVGEGELQHALQTISLQTVTP